MHAWAEVEHDLSYKPLSGNLSTDELAILDEINGLVLAGDIALQRLQHAFERRVNTGNPEFTNHYELAAFLYRELHQTDGNEYPLGRIDHLFQLLKAFNSDTPDAIRPYLSAIVTDPEHDRPIAEQLIDLFIADHPERYASYEDIRSRNSTPPEERNPVTQAALGTFLTQWFNLEHVLQQQNPGQPFRPHVASKTLAAPFRDEYERLRRIRNHIVHGFNIPPPEKLAGLGAQIAALRDNLQQATDSQEKK